ncbi:MAG TPA: TonB-dependent receptor [Vicinamibacterales bacterium]|nr:TonB-dependent receptor [Vicinamibacterales bacterium]
MSAALGVLIVMLATAGHGAAAPSDLSGNVLFSDLPVPGATVTATRGTRAASTVSDEAGAFHFSALDDGTWKIRVEMRGFVTATRDVTLPIADTLTVTLAMQSYQEIVRSVAPAAVAPSAEQPAPPNLDELVGVDVINGSVINGAATPFAQPRAFGNNRPRLNARYTGGVSLVLGNSAWNARPFSFAGSAAPAPSYGDVQVGFSLGGPLKIPWLVKNGPQMLLGYQHGLLHTATTQSALMPTASERAGDLTQSALGVRDPLTGLPFPGGIVPPERISPQAAALLAYYPLPNAADARGANYQTAIVTATTQDNLQFATSKAVTARTTLSGTFAFQRAATDSINLFDFTDTSRQSSLTTTVGWARRFGTRSSARLRYQFGRAATTVTPFFANRTNVSGEASIAGNSQDPADWGPPALSFPDIAGLRDADYQHSRSASHATGGDLLFKRGRHDITIGGDLRWSGVDVTSQGDPRGTLAFTGAATGSAFADFLLGIPSTSTIAFGSAGARLRGRAYDAYATDDWRLSGLTLNLGMRWEYETPFTEASGRLAGGLRPDRRGLEPRLGASWRPVPASSLVIRGSYGIYRNLGLYQPLALLLARQPPYSRTFSVQNGPLSPLTLANPFPASLSSATTFAVDPGFRAGYAHNWQASLQRDLPASLTAIAAYLGAKGSHLTQASLPNTYPAGAENPCPACPSGYVLVTSDGTSLRNALQLTLRRRLHNGFTANVQYTLAKSTDDAATFSNTAVSPTALAIAQDWLHLEAERGPSSFDQRHLVSAMAQYTSGVGVAGGTLADNVWGTLFKDWTIATQISAGSGLPFTPIFFAAVAGTGFVGVRPRLTGVAAVPAPSGAYANSAAYAAPLSGTWGDAGRNSIRGPAQVALDASAARVFRLNARLNLEWRVAATNVFNRVTFSTIETVIASPQFGRPTLANPMRRIQMTLRLRF